MMKVFLSITDKRKIVGEAYAQPFKLGADQKVADTLNNLGKVHKEIGEYNFAIEWYQEALHIHERFHIECIGDTYSI